MRSKQLFQVVLEAEVPRLAWKDVVQVLCVGGVTEFAEQETNTGCIVQTGCITFEGVFVAGIPVLESEVRFRIVVELRHGVGKSFHPGVRR